LRFANYRVVFGPILLPNFDNFREQNQPEYPQRPGDRGYCYHLMFFRIPALSKVAMVTVRATSLLPYITRQWRWLLTISVLTLLTSAAAALQPWPIKVLVDYALGGEPLPRTVHSVLVESEFPVTSTGLIVLAAVLSIGLFLLNSALTVGLSIAWSKAGQRMVYDLAADVFAHLQRLSLLFHSRRSVGDSLSRLMEDTWCVYSLAGSLLITPIQHVLTLGMIIWIGFFLDPLLAALAIAVAPLLATSSWFFGPLIKRRSHQLRDAKARLLSIVHQTLGALPVVQAFQAEERHTDDFRNFANKAVVLEQGSNRVGSMYGLVNGLITTAGLALVLYVGGVRVLSGAIPLGTLLVFVAYVRQMQGAAGGLFDVFTKLKAAQASIERLQEILNSDDLIRESPNAHMLPIGSSVPRGEIRLENVTFGYDAGRAVLENITLTACPGEMIALVGPTGAGKTTLVSLIPRFFDPWQGRVTFDGVDVRTVRLSSLRQAISFVLQEPFLLPITIAENIAYGSAGASRQDIVEAAISARADGFITRLPDGYDTVIGQSGATLSAGEQQRLAIARALLKDAPVLILDEPTSSLDAQTEAMLLDAIAHLTKHRTTFTIAHRMSTIRRANKIAVVDRGRIIALGTHEELMAASGLYEEFVRKQLSYGPTRVVA
jgi:ATP-binding cassette subfamily B protein/subfamily B ATP-binding cassette protein MsbA